MCAKCEFGACVLGGVGARCLCLVLLRLRLRLGGGELHSPWRQLRLRELEDLGAQAYLGSIPEDDPSRRP